MPKFYGNVGYAKTIETSPGVWEEIIVLKPYKGDILKKNIRWENNNKVNDNLNLSISISIVADSYAYENIGFIRFVEYMGSYWEVTSIDPQRPRLVLSIGGVYNGSTEGTSEDSC